MIKKSSRFALRSEYKAGYSQLGRRMLSRSTLIHLRIPFSYFLLPIYLFALSAAARPVGWKALLVFIILHLLLYPASNSFNSYYDRDTGSIGGIKFPPPVSQELLPVSLFLDAAAVGLGMLLDWRFALSVLVYGLCSKAYSWDRIRLKSRPLWSLFGTALIPGGLGFLMTYYGVQDIEPALLLELQPLWGAVLATLFLSASYPLTQIYQHEEDERRGDRTLSLVLGIQGTFVFSLAAFTLALAGLAAYYIYFLKPWGAVLIVFALVCPGIYFLRWMAAAAKDPARADFTHAMRLNGLTATALNLFFIALLIGERMFFTAA